jgi:hypothetical protein
MAIETARLSTGILALLLVRLVVPVPLFEGLGVRPVLRPSGLVPLAGPLLARRYSSLGPTPRQCDIATVTVWLPVRRYGSLFGASRSLPVTMTWRIGLAGSSAMAFWQARFHYFTEGVQVPVRSCAADPVRMDTPLEG